MKYGSLISGVFWLAFGILVTVLSTRYEIGNLTQPGPGFFPLSLGILLCVLSLVILAGEARDLLRSRAAGAAFGEGWIKVVYTMAILLVAAVYFETIGYLLTFFLMILLLMRVAGGQSWITTLIVAICTAGGAHFVFVELLKQPLPGGIFGA